MKTTLLTNLLCLLFIDAFSQTMQGTIKPGSQPRTIDLYFKPSASFSQKDEAMTFVIAIPASVQPAPTIGTSGVTPNVIGPVPNITGLQPNFLVNNLGSTSREVVVSTQTISGTSYYIYTFIFAGTATANHSWTAGIEQLMFSVQFNGCITNCNPNTEMLVNLPNGGINGNSYWYFQANTLGDITNYASPFYSNPQSTIPINGGSSDGSALSTISLAAPVSLPVKLTSFIAQPEACIVSLNWKISDEKNASFYSVERSYNGQTFTEVARVNSKGTGIETSYSYIDNTAKEGTVFYRLRLNDLDSKYSFSMIKEVKVSCSNKPNILVYPTFTNGLITVVLPQQLSNAQVKVISAKGEVASINSTQGVNRRVNLSALSKGTYFIQISANNIVVHSGKVVVQ